MQKNTVKSILSCLLAAAVALPLLTRAEDATPAPGAPSENAAPVKAKTKGTSFTGNLVSVDTNAMTLTVSNLTLTVTADTVIKSRSRAATLAEAADQIGKPTRGTYKKGDDGKLTALIVHLNSSGTSKGKKKKAAAPADSAN